MKKIYVLFLMLFLLPAQAAGAKQLRLVFTGDIMAHEEQLKAARFEQGYDFSGQFQAVRSALRGDVVIGNFETVLGGERFGYTGYPSFNAPDALADNLKDAGFHVLTLANNHILDKGPEAALRTREVLMDKGFHVTGVYPANVAPEPLLLEVNGARLGILNYTYGSNTWWPEQRMAALHLNQIDLAAIGRDLAFLRARKADIIVALFHWGVEYQFAPSAAQRKAAAFCLSQGVDLVVGTHPHILQAMETVRTGPQTQFVAWSLGNFVSYQRTLPRERSAILAVDFRREGEGWVMARAAAAPTWVQNTVEEGRRRIRILNAAADATPLGPWLAEVGQNILKTLALRAEPDLRGFHAAWRAEPAPDQARRMASRRALLAAVERGLESLEQWHTNHGMAMQALSLPSPASPSAQLRLAQNEKPLSR